MVWKTREIIGSWLFITLMFFRKHQASRAPMAFLNHGLERIRWQSCISHLRVATSVCTSQWWPSVVAMGWQRCKFLIWFIVTIIFLKYKEHQRSELYQKVTHHFSYLPYFLGHLTSSRWPIERPNGSFQKFMSLKSRIVLLFCPSLHPQSLETYRKHGGCFLRIYQRNEWTVQTSITCCLDFEHKKQPYIVLLRKFAVLCVCVDEKETFLQNWV